MRTILYAPHRIDIPYKTKKIFLAGSIEMGTAGPWQEEIPAQVDSHYDPLVFCNPRRPDWDWTWEQSMENPKFMEQVTWELDHIEEADIVFFYFDPATKSPISLMELGYAIGRCEYGANVVVFCPDGFWRQGNVEIICNRWGITMHRHLNLAIAELNIKLAMIRGVTHDTQTT